MSAKRYFPDSFSCRCSQSLPIRRTTSPPTQGSLSGCSGGASGVGDGDDDIREGGGSDAGGGSSLPPSLSLPQSRLIFRFAYNSALQNDLTKKKKSHPSCVERWKTSKVSNLQREKKKIYPAKQQATQNLVRWPVLPLCYLFLTPGHRFCLSL